MSACLLIGVLLILVGIVYVFVRSKQTSEAKTEEAKIEFEGVRLVGGPGLILIGLGILLIAFDTIIPHPVPIPPVPTEKVTEKVTEKPTEEPTTDNTMSAKIENVWFENGVWNGNLKGVRIHTAFNTENIKDKKCSIGAFFYNELDGTQLIDTNGYYAINGKVWVYDYFTPPYVSSSYSDFVLFIPYEEFHMTKGTAYLKFSVAITDGDNILDSSDWNSFSFIQN